MEELRQLKGGVVEKVREICYFCDLPGSGDVVERAVRMRVFAV